MKGFKECIEKTHWAVKELEKNGIVFPKPPVIKFDLRGRVAGRAWYPSCVIQFNPVLLSQNINGFLTDTVIHEVAHIGAAVKFGCEMSHDWRWQCVMRLLGGIPKQYHTYDISVATGQKSICPCREII